MRYVVIDLECTCWERGDKNRQPHEIIEIGAAFLDEKYQLIKTFSQFVKPADNIELTEYCTELTTITQKDINNAPPLSVAVSKLEEWMGPVDDITFCSWGYFDKAQLIDECNLHGITYPFTDDHINIKTRFSAKLQRTKKIGVKKALRILGIPFEGTPHRAISDAIMTAKIFKFIMEIPA